MNTRSKAFAALVITLGLSLGGYYTYKYLTAWVGGPNWAQELPVFISMLMVCALCRSLPLYLAPDRTIDISFIAVFAMFLARGSEAAAAMVLLSLPFIVERGYGKKAPFHHIFNTPLVKTLFNASTLVLAIAMPGVVFVWMGGVPGDLTLPNVLLPSLLFILLTLPINNALVLRLLTLLSGSRFWPALLSTVRGLLPNVVASAPIGFFMAMLLGMPSGVWLMLLFMMPLLLARYAFKLYVDSKNKYFQLISTLSAAMEAKDQYTQGHSRRVEQISVHIAQQMKLPPRKVEAIRVAALLHDIGKIGIDDSILRKPGYLSPEERRIIETHPVIATRILTEVDLPDNIDNIILHHHEFYNGKGYPGRITVPEVPLESFILGVADAYDAMTSDRPYRKGLSPEKAQSILREEAGQQFHPAVVDAFFEMLKNNPPEEIAEHAAAVSVAEKAGS